MAQKNTATPTTTGGVPDDHSIDSRRALEAMPPMFGSLALPAAKTPATNVMGNAITTISAVVPSARNTPCGPGVESTQPTSFHPYAISATPIATAATAVAAPAAYAHAVTSVSRSRNESALGVVGDAKPIAGLRFAAQRWSC